MKNVFYQVQFIVDDESNWTQYSPNGCVESDLVGDGADDCVDGADELEGAVTTCGTYFG